MTLSTKFLSGATAYCREDFKIALEIFTAGDAEGLADCMLGHARCYMRGFGVGRDLVYGRILLRRAEEHGVLPQLLQHAEDNHLAQYYIGFLYEEGLCGLKIDLKKAYIIYKKSAKAGSNMALLNVGVMHENGSGCKRDMKKGFLSYKEAAKKGCAVAAGNVGSCLQYGSVNNYINSDEAMKYYKQAIDGGYPTALINMGVLYRDGRLGLPIDDVVALSCFYRAFDMLEITAGCEIGTYLMQASEIIAHNALLGTYFLMLADDAAPVGDNFAHDFLQSPLCAPYVGAVRLRIDLEYERKHGQSRASHVRMLQNISNKKTNKWSIFKRSKK